MEGSGARASHAIDPVNILAGVPGEPPNGTEGQFDVVVAIWLEARYQLATDREVDFNAVAGEIDIMPRSSTKSPHRRDTRYARPWSLGCPARGSRSGRIRPHAGCRSLVHRLADREDPARARVRCATHRANRAEDRNRHRRLQTVPPCALPTR